ncbi:MAG: hypothetical protein U5L09_22885 [Bacteroidales bacterium]|nr:hypothetical protein [Bacteroidales bacterium]
MRRSLIITVLTVFALATAAQEVLTGVSENPVAKKRSLKAAPQQDSVRLTLPFFDDFSDGAVYPDSGRWSDRDALVNQDYAKFPVTVGVATLDAINQHGDIYPDASVFPFRPTGSPLTPSASTASSHHNLKRSPPPTRSISASTTSPRALATTHNPTIRWCFSFLPSTKTTPSS